MAKNTTKTTAKNTTKKTNAKKSATSTKKSEVMTFPQARALTVALLHSKATKKDMSEKIDKLLHDLKQEQKRPMKEEAKAKWLEEHGEEPCSYEQCKFYAFTLLNAKVAYEEVSALIDKLDKDSGYVRQPKEKAE